MYITPITKIHSTFVEAKEFYDKFGGIVIFDDEKRLSFADLTQGKRNFIIGEPGIGKTMLLGEIKEYLDKEGITTKLIGLREIDAVNRINSFLTAEGNNPKALLLDALDEVQPSLFPVVLREIKEISESHPNLSIYLSARWIFISRYASFFPEFRFITISPFTQSQVREYLLAEKHAEVDIEALFRRIMSFSHSKLVIQVPRYLFYLSEFLKENMVSAIAQISRNELFEYFIYRKLELEDKKLNADKRAITKRVLEKLALTMEIYQTNTISKDELMTFFDDLKSDLKFVALSQISLEVFFENSLLKVNQGNPDRIEFDNTEFQEYLAAKEITRFPDPGRVAFSFAVDPNLKEIYPTWFNALTFLTDMHPDMLEQIIEFSGVRGGEFRVVDEGFLIFLSRVDPNNVTVVLKRTLFTDLLEYHQKNLQWLPAQLAFALPGFFDLSLEGSLKLWVSRAELEHKEKRFVPLGNIAYVVGHLLRYGVNLDRAYWKEKLIVYASDRNGSDVLQREALFALGQLRDPAIIDELPADLMDSDELIVRGFLSLCTELDPENPKSLEYFFKAIRKDNFYGRYGLFEIKNKISIKIFLETFIADENFRREFLDDTSIFREKDQILVNHIEDIFDGEIQELCKGVITEAVDYNVAHDAERSSFVLGLWRLLKKKDTKGFVPNMVEYIRSNSKSKTGLYFAHSFFAEIIDKDDVLAYLDAMIAAGETNSAFSVMLRIKFSRREFSNEIFEAGRPKLEKDYEEWERAQKKVEKSPIDVRNEELILDFRSH